MRAEIRDNLLAALRPADDPWPGLHGFDDTVLPQLERALLAGHDLVLLGERGQGKTRLMRTLVGLLDEWTPVIAGSELNEHPFEPITVESQRRAAELGDDLPVEWRHRDERYAEKLATPDTSVGDLIGDVDPIKVAEGRTLGDPETVHYGLVPRSNRGIFAINELPDLAERIQVALLNVLEERDIQIRGYVLRLPLDLLLVASANPEDYTNRGRIITPLKDRFGAEIRTHYPRELDDEVAVIRQEAHLVAAVPDAPPRGRRPVHPGPARVAGGRPALRRLRPVRHRRRRDGRGRRAAPRAHAGRGAGRRPGRRPRGGARRAARQGRVRVGRGGPRARGARPPAAHLDRRDLPHAARRPRPAPDRRRDRGRRPGHTGERVSAGEFLQRPAGDRRVRGLDAVCERLDATTAASGRSALEFALEGLYLTRRIAKDSADGETVYG